MIIVDKREPVKWQLLGDYVDDILVDILVVGDQNIYVIERKTVSDLWKSLTSGRLWPQIDRVKRVAGELGGHPVLLVVGSPYAMARRAKRFSLAIWLGVIARLMEDGVMVLQVNSHEQARLALEVLRKRAGSSPEGRVTLPLKHRKILLTEREMAIAMLEGVRGIGFKRASELLSEYGSIREIVNLPEEELVKRLGREVGRRFYRVVRGEYGDE